MKAERRRRTGRRCAAGLLALLLFLCAGFAGAEQAGDAADVTLMMAQDAVEAFGLTDAEGQPLVPRKAPEMEGRGIPDILGTEPDYRGVVGYMTLQSSWDVSRFNTFTDTPWMLPVYKGTGDYRRLTGVIPHKTPVLVTEQELRESMGHKYAGFLRVVRLDKKQIIWIDVTQFITVPYWTLELREAVKLGFCIAAYRDVSRYDPMDRRGRHGPLPDGTRVLLCDARTARYHSPDQEHHPILGIVFRSREEGRGYSRSFLFFNQEDLTLIY